VRLNTKEEFISTTLVSETKKKEKKKTNNKPATALKRGGTSSSAHESKSLHDLVDDIFKIRTHLREPTRATRQQPQFTDVDAVDDKGATAFWVAASMGYTQSLRVLHNDFKANMYKTRGDTGQTPLYIAAYNGHKECVEELIRLHTASWKEENNTR